MKFKISRLTSLLTFFVLLHNIQLKSFLSLQRLIVLSFSIYPFLVVDFQINRFFLLSFNCFIVLSFYRFFGKKHRVYSIVLSFYRFIVLSFYRWKENIEFFLSFYRCKNIVLPL